MPEPIDIATATDAAAELYASERFKKLIEDGVFYGRTRTKTNPRMKPYILATRNDIEIIDLDKTLEGLETALDFLKDTMRKGKTVLVVGTQPQAIEGAAALAREFNLLSASVRWLGGLLTNFKVFSKRIEHYKKLKSELQSGALEKYTKKERLGFGHELRRLEEFFGGLENYTALPGALLVIDPTVHLTAVREARRLKIPIVAYMNTDGDPDLVEYPVIGNTKAKKSIAWFLEKVAEAMREVKTSEASRAAESADAAPANPETSSQ